MLLLNPVGKKDPHRICGEGDLRLQHQRRFLLPPLQGSIMLVSSDWPVGCPVKHAKHVPACTAPAGSGRSKPAPQWCHVLSALTTGSQRSACRCARVPGPVAGLIDFITRASSACSSSHVPNQRNRNALSIRIADALATIQAGWHRLLGTIPNHSHQHSSTTS